MRLMCFCVSGLGAPFIGCLVTSRREGSGISRSVLLQGEPSHYTARCSRLCSPMYHVDSKAVFSARVKALGLTAVAEKFEELGWTTLGSFAFAAGMPSGAMVDEATFRTRVLVPLFELGEGVPEPALSAGVRRLWFEAHSIMIQDLRRHSDRTDDEPPRRIPAVEREERKTELATRLRAAFRMEGELEPANFLIDRYMQLAEDGQIEWVPWEECPKREQELQQGRGRK